MNIKRGLFRIWVVLSAAFVVLVGVQASRVLPSEFAQQAIVDGILASAPTSKGVPVLCSRAAPDSNRDYGDDDMGLGLCWVPLASREAAKLDGAAKLELVKELYSDASENLWVPDPWWTVTLLSLLGVGFPLIVLAVVAAIYWVVAGFARKPQADQ